MGIKHNGFIAQLGERTTEDRKVLGSIPSGAKGAMSEWSKEFDSSSNGRSSAQVRTLLALLSADIKRIGRMVKWKSLLTSNQLFRVRSPVWLLPSGHKTRHIDNLNYINIDIYFTSKN